MMKDLQKLQSYLKSLSPYDLAKLDKELILAEAYSWNLIDFTQAAWHILEPAEVFVRGKCLEAICEHLEAVTSGLINKIIINVPPGCMKSLLCNVFWPAWEWGPKKLMHNRFLCASYKRELSSRDSRKMKILVMSDWYQRRFGQVVIAKDKRAKMSFENTKGGFREACAIDSLTGARAHRVILDDPLNVKQAASDAELLSAEGTFLEAVPSRIVSEHNSAIIIIMQRLHERDTTGIALKKELGYEHLMLPMEYESDRKCRTKIGFQDWREKENELLFPERFSQNYVDGLKKSLGEYAYAAQAQQRPAPRGGGLIKDAWWGWYDLEWDDDFQTITNRFDYIIQAWDTAFKVGEENDFSVGITFGVTKNGVYLIDRYRDKVAYPDLVRDVKKGAEKYRLKLLLIEDKASGQSLVQSLKAETLLPIKAVKISTDKVSRLNAVSSYIETGKVFLPRNSNWVNNFMCEIGSFPAAAHDDQVDALTLGLSEIFLKVQPKNIKFNHFSR